MGGQKNTGFVWTPTKRRGPIAAEFSTPGPAAIGLPSSFGPNVAVKPRSPAFTISGRFEAKLNTASPGPGQYNINGLSYKGKDEPHAPSMHIRPKDPKPFITPAPGDYCPEKSKKVLDPSPKFSFGIKTENGAAPDVPGPGTYNDAIVDKYKAAKSPAFSLGQRTNIPSDHTQKPGPGAHSPEKCMSASGPKFSFGLKLRNICNTSVPGPGTYNCPDPDVYLEKSPVFSLSPRTQLPADNAPKPSPNTYKPEKCMQDGTPKWTMAPRLKEPSKLNVPGPGSYEAGDLDAVFEKQPVFTMRPKTEIPTDKGPKPSPNAYCPEKCMPDDAPKWTIAPRTEIPCDKSPKPAPNAYNPDETAMSRRNPEFSFGIKHSQYLGQLRDQ